jgi:hypothetical protein
MRHLQPGDILAVQEERRFGLASASQKLAGYSGNFTHIGTVTHDGQVIDTSSGHDVRKTDPSSWLESEHILILRPQYGSEQTRKNTVDHLTSYLPGGERAEPKLRYDDWHNLKTDDKQYCLEFFFKAARVHSPELELEPSSRFGYKMLAVDDFKSNPHFQTIFSTDSNFWINQVSRFA